MLKVLCMFGFLFVYIECRKPGLQMRLTENGMKYAVDVGIKIMKEDLLKKTINEKGKGYAVKNLRITKAEFPEYKLTPVAGIGMQGAISGIAISANGDVSYSIKKGWFKFSDTIGISLDAYNIQADLLLAVGADPTGHPTIDMKRCTAGVDKLDLNFHGGGSWIYKIFKSIIAKQLRKSFGKLLCSIAEEEINTRAKSELATFPVTKKLDKWAVIDYSLTSAPQFTNNYMDAYLKGEFKARNNPVDSQLSIPPITSSSSSDRMLYFWLTDYTINTAGEVYHNTGFLSGSFYAWDNNMPQALKTSLNTKSFGIMLPKLYAKYPNAAMGLDAYTYKAPTVHIMTDKVMLKLYTQCTFSVMSNNKIIKLFDAKFDIHATAEVGSKGDNITAKIDTFDYDAIVEKEYVSGIGAKGAPLNSPLVKMILDMTVISKANPVLGRGFPLPKIKEVNLQNFKISLVKDAIQIGSDVQYVKDNK